LRVFVYESFHIAQLNSIDRHSRWAEYLGHIRGGLIDYPAVNAFLDRMAARPAFQRAMANCLPNGAPPF